jgi:asparagine synthase (glutamine-hydrolysing)
MCGIAALAKSPSTPLSPNVLLRMREAVAHRGPDDCGAVFLDRTGVTWTSRASGEGGWRVGLGHRRLSILDLSAAARQPLHSMDDGLWLLHNGEIYNYVELRAELRGCGHEFHTTSDTEVVLAAYREWGPDCFERFRGMWALVLFDGTWDRLVLSRDRLGIKPLVMWSGVGLFAAVSEIKQLLEIPGFTSRLNPVAALRYLRSGYVDPESSFFSEVRPVPAGTWLSVPVDSLTPSNPCSFWHPERIRPRIFDVEEAGRAFAASFQDSLRMHLRSDVPVGCALSGGLDSSSIVVSVDQERAGRTEPLDTFTMTFPGDTLDERAFAEAVTTRARSRPHFVTPTARGFMEDLQRFVWSHDEPTWLSEYGGYCVARLTHEAGIRVTLSGQGGDELFAGYWQSYSTYLYELFRTRRLLALARHIVGAGLPHGNRTLLRQLPLMLQRYLARTRSNLELCIPCDDAPAGEPLIQRLLDMGAQERRVYEMRTLILPKLLKWDDRNTMAFSIEGRYPFLDHVLVEQCLEFGEETLYRAGWTKWALRRGLRHLLPPEVLWRRSKFGFAFPQDTWLCGPLRPHLERWLDLDQRAWQFVRRSQVRALADQTWRLRGRRPEPGQALLRVFFFANWCEQFRVSA